jgi:hypothetical protein
VSQPQPPAQPSAQPPAGLPAYGPPPGLGQQPAYPTSPAVGYPAPQFAGQNYPAPHPAAQPGPPQAYPQQAHPQQAYPQAYPTPAGQLPGAAPGQLPLVSCRLCGSVPAVKTTFRGHQGMIVVMRFLRFEGPFCRDCGLGTFRHMTSRTLVQGWYGYGSFIITPITVLINLFKRNKVAKLPAPQPNPFGPSRQPMNPGPRLLARPMTWLGLCIPVVVFGLILVAILSSDG